MLKKAETVVENFTTKTTTNYSAFMSIISHIHLSQQKKFHHLANNIHAVDFLA
ncbi:MAG: hypothetical protein ACJA2G_001715 [Cognaticolwellia sp.]|jgi:hypothetical protein